MKALMNSGNGRMTSLQIAEITGKQHKNVVRDIRNMEDAWVKVNRLKFELIDYTDSRGRKQPMYSLTKLECLYIATKYEDEARARLVLRWHELETDTPTSPQSSPRPTGKFVSKTYPLWHTILKN